mmetsp:Transcript_19540/g.39577  ORF Transcript_19540/g.39577 Transcript_19540/m.39577 type:complete len:516 (-) Transcript_19540:63-1610(-)
MPYSSSESKKPKTTDGDADPTKSHGLSSGSYVFPLAVPSTPSVELPDEVDPCQPFDEDFEDAKSRGHQHRQHQCPFPSLKLMRSRPAQRTVPAFLFDIDGVFKTGALYSRTGAAGLRKIFDAGLPFVFLTNGGGGRTEMEYAEEMRLKLLAAETADSSTILYDVEEGDKRPSIPSDDDLKGNYHRRRRRQRGKELVLREDQMVLSYSPFRSHLEHLKSLPVLIVGSKECLRVAKQAYGFRRAVHIDDYSRDNPLLNPFKRRTVAAATKTATARAEEVRRQEATVKEGKEDEWGHGPFKAVLVFTDPSDFFDGLQIITDVLLSSRPNEVEYEKGHLIPCYFSAGDLLWKSQHRHARFGLGAFRLALESLYSARMRSLGLSEAAVKARLSHFYQYGKPTLKQFKFGRDAVLRQARRLGCRISHFYVVGDNPRSDIHGAVQMAALAQHNPKRQINDNQANKSRHQHRPNCEPSWSGLLVRTGVWSEGDPTYGAAGVFDNVNHAIDHVLRQRISDVFVA